ncbi:MerR family transcriptional regulator [Jeotgalibacillus salarius]|uniref:MerR family transcriptional regulator n=1 Tax=Jeotgalibacillus salarius TaxID=546023 RepID=A0A4Y8LG52_9BACL|nr:MerR family transcriptional regulator [Jeotgalibacillus salarius]TFD99496.1 MerR family transcriptional regulator [Jeotgalibacillus salarius]
MWTTGQIAKMFNISLRTLRYYDEIDLVKPGAIEEGGRRIYGSASIVTLEKVLLLKKMDLPLDEVRRIVSEEFLEAILERHLQNLNTQSLHIQDSIDHTVSLKNEIRITGDIDWDKIFSLVKREQDQGDWSEHFSVEQQESLQAKLPKLNQDTETTNKWIRIIKRIEHCLRRGDLPSSEEGQILAEDIRVLSDELFNGDKELEEKFWDIRRSENASSSLNFYPIREEVLMFLEEVMVHHLAVSE